MSGFDQLRAFIAVAEEQSFTAAARRLGVAQPALSRQVRLLETQLGGRLLIRTTRSVQPTELGRALLESGREVVDAFDDLWSSIRYRASGRQGSISIAHSASVAYETIPSLVDALLNAQPGIELDTMVLPPSDALDAVGRDSSTLAILRGERGELEGPGLELDLLRVERRGVLVPLSHRLARRKFVGFSDLEGERILLHRRELNPSHHDYVVAACRAAGFEPEIVSRSVDFDPAFSPVRSGRAITVQSESVVEGAIAGLAWVPFRERFVSEVWIVTRPAPEGSIIDVVRTFALEFAATSSWLEIRSLAS